MSFKKGNELWKLRTKHGREKLFSSPDLLWEAVCEYFQYVQDNPIEVIEVSGGKKIKVQKARVMTWTALCFYLGVSDSFFKDFLRQGKVEFSPIIDQIRQIIHTQKFEGAASGVFNANFIARDLNMAEKSENTNLNSEELSPEKIKELSQALENEY